MHIRSPIAGAVFLFVFVCLGWQLSINMEVTDFCLTPSEEGLEACNKEQIILIAEHYKINLGDKRAARDHL